MSVPSVDGIPVCDPQSGAAGWTLLVRAGFNDIDRRCDSYLAWLNARRRNRNAILSQITDTRNFTEAVMFTAGASASALTVAGLAFGLASNTFTNYYSRLLLEIEKSTVEVLVHEKRLQYREALNTRITSRPDAIHVLREYLLICTPHYIENKINQRTRDSVSRNPSADDEHAVQIRRSIVAGALLKSIPAGPREELGDLGKKRQQTEEKITGDRLTVTERSLVVSQGKVIQQNLCVNPAAGHFGPPTREAIRQAKIGANASGPNAKVFADTSDQIMSPVELEIFRAARRCSQDARGTERGYRTAFEKFRFPDAPAINALQKALTGCDPNIKVTGIFDAATRTAIQAAKQKASPERPATFTDLDKETLNTLNDRSHAAISLTCSAL